MPTTPISGQALGHSVGHLSLDVIRQWCEDEVGFEASYILH